MTENNEASMESNCIRGGFTLKASRLGGAVLRPPVLGPSVLGSSLAKNGSNSSTSLAKSGDKKDEKGCNNAVQNPFLRGGKDDEDSAEVVDSTAKSDKDDEIDERPDPLMMLRNNGKERASMFAATAKNSAIGSTGFVFGQNVHERVIGENINTETNAKVGTSETAEATSSQLLFSSVIQKAASSSENNDGTSSNKEAEAKSLKEVAREYVESRAQKRKFEEVETFTGEENEINIIDISCKLFAFVNSNWEERGRGSLRLNDAKDARENSRVVFRTSGNLRLLLNTKVWAAMVADRASPRSLRLTAMDNTGTVKIFLAMGRLYDIAQLHKALSERIAKRKLTHPEECVATDNSDKAKNGDMPNSSADNRVTTSQPESTTNDEQNITDAEDDVENCDDEPSQSTKSEEPITDADSVEPSPKKAVTESMADSSADIVNVHEENADVDSIAEGETEVAAQK